MHSALAVQFPYPRTFYSRVCFFYKALAVVRYHSTRQQLLHAILLLSSLCIAFSQRVHVVIEQNHHRENIKGGRALSVKSVFV